MRLTRRQSGRPWEGFRFPAIFKALERCLMHVVIVGGGAALAQPIMRYYLQCRCQVTAVCHKTLPTFETPKLKVVGLDADFTDKPVDVLITLTGSTWNARLHDLGRKAWDTVIEDSLTSVYLTLRSILPHAVYGGNVVVVGSIVGSLGGVGCANYAAAKAGLVGLVRTAANEHPNLHINLLELGYVNCGMGASLDPRLREKITTGIPLKRFAEAEEVVEAIAFLARTKYMTGNVLTFAGGLR